MREFISNLCRSSLPGLFLIISFALAATSKAAISLHNPHLTVAINPQGETNEIRAAGMESPVLQSQVGAEVNHKWLRSKDYPHHEEAETRFQDALGAGRQATITFTGLSFEPDLVCILRLYNDLPYGTVQVKVVNHTSKPVSVEAIRDVDATGSELVNLGGPQSADRVMFEGYTEDPTIKIGGLDQAPKGTYFGARDGLIYNTRSKQSLLIAALTADRFMTALHLKAQRPSMGSSTISSFTVDSTGTTEAVLDRDPIAPEQQIELSLPVAAGKELSSELVMFAAGPDYHAQLEAYGVAIRRMHNARVTSEPPMGWWNWTAFYGGITQEKSATVAVQGALKTASHLLENRRYVEPGEK